MGGVKLGAGCVIIKNDSESFECFCDEFWAEEGSVFVYEFCLGDLSLLNILKKSRIINRTKYVVIRINLLFFKTFFQRQRFSH